MRLPYPATPAREKLSKSRARPSAASPNVVLRMTTIGLIQGDSPGVTIMLLVLRGVKVVI